MAGGDVCSSESFNEDIAVFSKQVILVFFELITFNLPRKLKHEWSAPPSLSSELRSEKRAIENPAHLHTAMELLRGGGNK